MHIILGVLAIILLICFGISAIVGIAVGSVCRVMESGNDEIAETSGEPEKNQKT